MDLAEMARRLEREEVLQLKYLCPVRSTNDGVIEYEERIGRLLDISVDAKKLFVRCASQVIWIKPEEVVALVEEAA